ncbi:MAG: hypothetical protein GY869_15440, partial [Planctomycetes bacterium]|nr:hypothetical protein [Planctomycetota bacterium]
NLELTIGVSNLKGALIAQGTVDDPILFTSNAETPAPGDWQGICFEDATDDTLTIIEHCTIEYGGYSNLSNIRLNNASPTIQYNTLRNSSSRGIYINGTGCNAAAINCNNLKDNHYGIYLISNAQPSLFNNNFLNNQDYGIYNSSTGITIIAEDNWWDDIGGPNLTGDQIYGNVDYDPWLTAESGCVNAPPTNSPPFTPSNPTPAHQAVRIPVLDEGLPIDVAVSWTGGDPNPWDTVVYDIYSGTESTVL